MYDNSVQGVNIWRRRSIIAAIIVVVIIGAAAGWGLTHNWNLGAAPVANSSAAHGNILPPKPELQLYKPLLPGQAMLENYQLPFSNAPIERAMPLVLPPSQLLPIGRRNAIDCLTSAIYYEAGNETRQGKQAVVQVILNRVRHPAFPKSICGVVYQGSERKTGCQFTFTCDGSLARQPVRDRWEQARLIAIGAISGAVEPSVGMATHYHANYVLPYWAPSLDKISQIGTHIFYRWKGSWGKRRAFSQVVQLDDEALPMVTVGEIPPVLDEGQIVPASATKLPSRIIADDISTAGPLTTPSTEIAGPVVSEIRADQAQSTLTADLQKSTLKRN